MTIKTPEPGAKGRPSLPGALHVFDTETTGVNVAEDRILTCYSAEYLPDMRVLQEHSWTIDPGVDVPEGAAAVHGMSTQWIKANGRKDPQNAVGEIFNDLMDAAGRGVPIVAFNLRYDLTLLHYELLRHGWPNGAMPLLERGVFYDALVHDKGRDKFRKGGRKLQALCEHYGIEFNEEDAHAAEYDVLKTAELSWKLIAKERKLGVAELMPLLVEWKQEQDSSLEGYFSRTGKKNEDGSAIKIDRGWPLITKRGN